MNNLEMHISRIKECIAHWDELHSFTEKELAELSESLQIFTKAVQETLEERCTTNTHHNLRQRDVLRVPITSTYNFRPDLGSRRAMNPSGPRMQSELEQQGTADTPSDLQDSLFVTEVEEGRDYEEVRQLSGRESTALETEIGLQIFSSEDSSSGTQIERDILDDRDVDLVGQTRESEDPVENNKSDGGIQAEHRTSDGITIAFDSANNTEEDILRELQEFVQGENPSTPDDGVLGEGVESTTYDISDTNMQDADSQIIQSNSGLFTEFPPADLRPENSNEQLSNQSDGQPLGGFSPNIIRDELLQGDDSLLNDPLYGGFSHSDMPGILSLNDFSPGDPTSDNDHEYPDRSADVDIPLQTDIASAEDDVDDLIPGSPNYFEEQLGDSDGAPVNHLEDLLNFSGQGSKAPSTSSPDSLNFEDGITDDRLIPEGFNDVESGFDYAEEIDSYIKTACDLGFQLPDQVDKEKKILKDDQVHALFLPLIDGSNLDRRLILSLLCSLLPSPLNIFEYSSNEWKSGSFLEEDEGIAAAFYERPQPLLVVLNAKEREKFVIGSSEPAPPDEPTLAREWEIICLDPQNIQPETESTLVLVALAEAYVRHRQYIKVSAKEFQFKYTKALLGNYRSEIVLQNLGIPRQQIPYHQKIVPTCMPDLGFSTKNELYELGRSRSVTDKQLRIVQVIYEIGSLHILETLQAAAATLSQDDEGNMGMNGLPQIYHYLDTQGATSHLAIARMRYVTYCYHQTFQNEVHELQEMKRLGRAERKSANNRRTTESFKQGQSIELQTPTTDWIKRHYPGVDEDQTLTSFKAADMVRHRIAKRIEELYGGDPKIIQAKLKNYMRVGKTLGSILRAIDPALLILFPGKVPAPSFDVSTVSPHTMGNVSRQIKIKDIDGLNESEAIWFGDALRVLRPELLAKVPNTAQQLLSGLKLQDGHELQDRDPGHYLARPISFLA